MSQKTHAEQLTADYNIGISQLYHKGDLSKPLFSEGELEVRTKQINARYIAGLFEIKRAAEAQKERADQLEARARQDPSNHLSDAELQAASLRKPFIAKDAQKLDIQSFCEVAKQEAIKGHKASCLAYLEVMPESSSVPEQRIIDDTKETLKQVLIPPDLRNAGQRAQQLRYDAEVERVSAKSALFDLSGQPAGNFDPFS